MNQTLVMLLGLLLAAAILWVRRARVRRPAFRVALLILALALAYPAINGCYIGAKHFVAGWATAEP